MSDRQKAESKWDVQLRKGTLELVVLAALRERRLYGLELLRLLHCLETTAITEGTLYPLMDRLNREGVIAANWQQEGQSRPKKYYQLTEQGEEKLASLTLRWRKSVLDIDFLINNPGPKTISPRGE